MMYHHINTHTSNNNKAVIIIIIYNNKVVVVIERGGKVQVNSTDHKPKVGKAKHSHVGPERAQP